MIKKFLGLCSTKGCYNKCKSSGVTYAQSDKDGNKVRKICFKCFKKHL